MKKELNSKIYYSVRYSGVGKPEWDPKNTHYRYTVTVNGARFPFWTSAYDYQKSQKTLDEAGERHALHCVLNDALSYIQNPDIDQFAGEFGYPNIKKVVRVFKACKRTFDKLGLSEDELCDAVNQLNEMED